MAKKKLLNEAVVRRFMGLAGMESNLVSNAINEMYNMSEEDEELDAEEEPVDDEAAMDDPEAGGEEMDLGAPEGGEELPAEEPAGEPMEDDVREISAEDVETLRQLSDELPAIVAKLDGGEPMGEPMDAPPADDAAMDLDAPEDEADMLEGVELELSEDEVVQEVARRVAKRILKAKRAKSQLDEALGRKTRR